MRVNLYDVSVEDDGSGDGSHTFYCGSFQDANRTSVECAKAEIDSRQDDDDPPPTTQLSSVCVQELVIEGSPAQCVSAALAYAGCSAEWIGRPKGIYRLGRRWRVQYSGLWVEESDKS